MDIWCEKILYEFRNINYVIYDHLHKELKVPNFDISLDPSSKWGSWCKETRTISISLRLLRNYPWRCVVDTLKHEVAHMIDDEIFMNSGGHGEGFNKACTVLGTDNSEYASGDDILGYIDDNEEMVNRVCKLMALGESSNKHEAELAITKAHELMVKYNIKVNKERSNRVYITRPLMIKFKKTPIYVMSLISIISRYYCVNSIRCGDRLNGQYYEIFGQTHNLDIAEHVFYFLMDEGEREWVRFKKGIDMNGYSKISFLKGFYSGFESILKVNEAKVKEVLGENVLPMPANDKLLNDKFKEAYPHTRMTYCNSGNNKFGYSAGFDKGKNVKINPCIKSSRSNRLMIA